VVQRFLTWLGSQVQALLGLVLPVFGELRPSRLGWLVRAVLHVVLLALLVVGLYFLNDYLGIAPDIATRWPWVRRTWLSILFLLVYALCWLSYWLWRLLTAEEGGGEFPDIDEAWAEAREALRRAGLGLTELPLFLVLGQPEDDEKALFQAAELALKVRQTPGRPEAPIHVYASQEAIYVTCPDASLFGSYAASLAGIRRAGASAAAEEAAGDDDVDVLSTMSPGSMGPPRFGKGGPLQDMQEILRVAEGEGRPLDKLSKVEKRQLRAAYRRANRNRSVLRDPEWLGRQSARLRHLCRLLVRDRHPFCAANGLLLLIPFAATDSEQDAADAGDLCGRDLAVAAALKVDCPLFALVCDMETAPGFSEFIQRFSARERRRRLGQRCPLRPDLRGGPARTSAGADPRARVHASLASWLGRDVVRVWVYQKFQLEKRGQENPAALAQTNARLFLLYDELQERSRWLGEILSRGLAGRPADRCLFGGCYVAGTGADAGQEQAFVAGVFERLMESQSYVYWTEQAWAEERRYRRWVSLGWAALAAVGLAALALLAFAARDRL
jgi:hypothetical protein